MRKIDADALLNDLEESAKSAMKWREETKYEEIKIRAEQAHVTFLECALRVKEAPTIEPEALYRKRCEFCKGRSFTNKPLTVITRTMKRVEVDFNFCPKCGRDMRVNDANAGRKEVDEDAVG